MMRAFTGTTLLVMIGWFGAGDAATQNGPVRNRVACDSLAGLAVPAASIGLPSSGATVAAAELVPAAPQTLTVDRAVLATPEYCRVTGRISPVDPAAPPINFHVNLPTSWNRKLAQLGGSGQNGVIPVALTTGMQWGPESIPPNAPYALSRGFVVYGSDSGHQGAGGRGAWSPCAGRSVPAPARASGTRPPRRRHR